MPLGKYNAKSHLFPVTIPVWFNKSRILCSGRGLRCYSQVWCSVSAVWGAGCAAQSTCVTSSEISLQWSHLINYGHTLPEDTRFILCLILVVACLEPSTVARILLCNPTWGHDARCSWCSERAVMRNRNWEPKCLGGAGVSAVASAGQVVWAPVLSSSLKWSNDRAR